MGLSNLCFIDVLVCFAHRRCWEGHPAPRVEPRFVCFDYSTDLGPRFLGNPIVFGRIFFGDINGCGCVLGLGDDGVEPYRYAYLVSLLAGEIFCLWGCPPDCIVGTARVHRVRFVFGLSLLFAVWGQCGLGRDWIDFLYGRGPSITSRDWWAVLARVDPNGCDLWFAGWFLCLGL